MAVTPVRINLCDQHSRRFRLLGPAWYNNLERYMTMTTEHANYTERIVTDPQILVGKPVIKGTRIAVEHVLEYLAHTPNFEEFFADYPELTMEDVQACLAYAQAVVEGEDVTPAPRRPGHGRTLHPNL